MNTKKLNRFVCYSIILLSFGWQMMWSQSYLPGAEFTISQLALDDGLSQGSNDFLYEDSQGFMWITCNDALNRFDGKMVKVYNLQKYFKNCLPLLQGYGIVEDEKSNLYIGSIKGLYVYHRNKDQFTLAQIYAGSDKTAMPICCKEGKIWCFNKSWQLATYDIQTDKVCHIAQASLPLIPSIHAYANQVHNTLISYPFCDLRQTIWLVSESDIFTYNIQTGVLAHPLKTSDQNRSLFRFKEVFYDTSANTIYFYLENGLLQYDYKTGSFKRKKELQSKRISELKNIYTPSNGYITQQKAIALGWIHKPEPNKLSETIESLLTPQFKKLRFDKSGKVWISFYPAQGQLMLDFHPPLLPKKPAHSFQDTFQLIGGVQSFGELPNGNILINHGMLLHSTKTMVKAPDIYCNRGGRFSIDSFRNGLWFYGYYIGSYQGPFISFFDQANHVKTVVMSYAKDSLEQINDLVVLKDGRILCTLSQGLSWLNPATHSFTNVRTFHLINPFKINILSGNRLAISYLGNDMRLLQTLPNDSMKELQRILPGVQAFYMQEDTIRKRFWVGSNEGVYLLDRHFCILKKFDANTGMAGANIYGLLLDDSGNVWCSHQHGLSSIDANTFQLINYDKKDGIQDWDFNNRSFYKAKDGTLYFGGISGFNFFKPPLMLTNFGYDKAEVYVDEIKVNNKIYLPDTNANYIAFLKLSPNENYLSFNVIVKDLSMSVDHDIIYRLKNTDIDWSHLPNKSIIQFNNLAPGSYTLELGIRDKFKNSNVIQKRILISVTAPFYKHLWFVICVTILLSSIVLWWVHRRKLLRQKIRFEQEFALEKQRSKITSDLHDDIGSALSSLQLNSHVAAQVIDTNQHKAKQILYKIESQAQSLSDIIGDFVWSMKQGKEEFMSLSKRIQTFVSDILGSTQIHYSIHIDKDIDTSIRDITMRKNIVMIVKEAVNNAAKYSKASEISIRITRNHSQIEIAVEDNGNGMNPEEPVRVGNGIQNMRTRATELGAALHFITAPMQGTKIHLNFTIPEIRDSKSSI